MASQAVLDADWYDKQRQDVLVAVAVTMTCLSGIFVTLRCIGRFGLNHNPGMDDYLILGAMTLLIGYTVDIFLMKYAHAGYPVQLLSLDDIITILKVTLSIEVIYYATLCCIKTSILFSYLRFAISHKFRWLCIGTIVLHTIFFIICIGVTLAQCQPLEKVWDLMGTVEGYCIDSTAFFYSTSGFNIVTDIWILILPIPTLRSIQRPRHEKIALMFIFGIGWFAAICSIVRLHTIYTFTLSEDKTRDSLLVNIWSLVEVGVAISCASVPGIKSVLTWNKRRTATQTAKSGSGGAETYDATAKTWNHRRLDSKEQNSQSTGTSTDVEKGLTQGYMGTTYVAHPLPAALSQQQTESSGKLTDTSPGMSQESNVGASESMLFTPLAPRPTARVSEPDRQNWLSSDSSLDIGKAR